VVTGGADHDVGIYALSPDSRTVYFLAEDAGHARLFRAPATAGGGGGHEQEVGTMTSGTFGGLQIADGAVKGPVRVAAVWESATNPPEVVRVDPATARWTPLTKFNVERAARIDWQPLREFWFTSSKGKRIHSFYAVPPGFDSTKTYPLFVLIHGGAANMWTDNFGLRWNPHLLGAADFGCHFKFAVRADRAGLHVFDAGDLGARLEAQRPAFARLLIGLARAQRHLEPGAFELDLHRLRRAYTLAVDAAHGVHAADLAAIEQHAHPGVVGRGGMRGGSEREQGEEAEEAQHGGVTKEGESRILDRTIACRPFAILEESNPA